MPDTAVTPHVFLDTEVFDAHQLDFDSPNIRRVAARAVEGRVHILLPSVTEREIRAHQVEKASEAFKEIKKLRRSSRTVRKALAGPVLDGLNAVTEETILATLRGEFDAFIAETRAESVRVDGVSPEAVFAKYFAGTAPFGGGKKKHEFPDAFTCGSLEAWSAAHNNEKIYVVSKDGDWKRVCTGHAVFIQVDTIEELLELYANAALVEAIRAGLEERREELQQLIEQQAEDFDYYPGDQLVDGEIDAVEQVEVDIQEFHIVEAADGKASVSVYCELKVTVAVVADDANSGIYDHEDKTMHYVYRASGTVSRELELTVEVEITYEQEHPENITIDQVKIEDRSFDLGVEETELERDYDGDEWEEYDPPEGSRHHTMSRRRKSPNRMMSHHLKRSLTRNTNLLKNQSQRSRREWSATCDGSASSGGGHILMLWTKKSLRKRFPPPAYVPSQDAPADVSDAGSRKCAPCRGGAPPRRRRN